MSCQERRIGDLCTVGRGSSPRPINDQRFFENGEIPWIKVADATASGKFLLETKLYVNRHGASFSRLLPVGSLIICTSGTLGLPIILGVEGCIHDGWLYTYDYKGLDPEFFYYFLQTQRNYFASVAYGAAIQNINTEILRNTTIRLPMLDVQSRIASVLKSYDDLIENNRRRMDLLEESARQLYSEWFVRLRFPGYEHTRIVDGVPEGWERKRIGDIADCIGGGTPSTKVANYWEDGDVTWVTPTDVTRNRHFVLLDSEKKITQAGLKKSSTKLVPPHAVLMTSRASVGYFAIAGREVCTNQGFISVVPCASAMSAYLLFHLSNRVDEIRAMGSGSTYPEVSRTKFREFQVLVPSRVLVDEFGGQATLLLNQIRVLKQQNQKLRAARDLLLPRLMSGEISV